MHRDHGNYVEDDAADRRLALQSAVSLDPGREHVTHVADDLYAWLRARPSIAPAALVLTAGPIVLQNGVAMTASLNLADTQEVAFAVAAVDSKGFPAADGPYTWTSPDDSAGAVISLAVSDDTTSCTVSAVAPGQATVQVADPSGISGAELVVVTAGPVASLVLSAGTPSDEAPAVPAGA